MVRKSEAEVELIRESARWCEHAHRLLQEYSTPGATEAEASLRAGHEATLAMLEALGPSYAGQQASSDGVTAGYRGQIGLRSSWAHAVAHNIEFQAGDVLVTETAAPIWGYNAELERAMIVGAPTDEMRRLFDHTVAAQQVAFDALRPGVTCSDVDRAVLAYFEANDLLPHWRQHVGHGIGLRNHEAPFLDVGDHTPVEPGMVFTIEPGLYSSTVGGFRHSDTVVVTPDGIDVLTDYTKDIESLTDPRPRPQRREQLLVAPLLVRHALLDRLLAAGGHHLHRLDDEEEHGGPDRDELDHGRDERAVAEHRVVDREGEVAEVGLADDHRDDRHDQVVDERGDHRRERDAHDERDRELDDVAAEQEVLELLDHVVSSRVRP